MDPLTVAAGFGALAGLGSTLHMRRRARRAEAQIARLHDELRTEHHAASHDELTGLPNRRAFYQLGASLIAERQRSGLVAVVLDLNDFKLVNDRFGHAAGDQVLVTVARRFAVQAGDNLVARLGGDEFAGLLTDLVPDRTGLHLFIRQLTTVLAAPMQVAGHSLSVTASIGVAPLSGRIALADALRHADAAMYQMKLGGRGGARETRPARLRCICCTPAALAVAMERGPAHPAGVLERTPALELSSALDRAAAMGLSPALELGPALERTPAVGRTWLDYVPDTGAAAP